MRSRKMILAAAAAWLCFGAISLNGGIATADPIDTDGDLITDDVDNCPSVANADQVNADGDLLGDACDKCSSSDVAATVVIDGCDSKVGNPILATGCSIADLVDGCVVGAKNHGKYVSCVSKTTNNLKKAKVITGKQKGAIQSCAAQADLP